MSSLTYINRELVKTVPWSGDPVSYDMNLFNLGQGAEEFIVFNPNVLFDVNTIIKRVPQTDRCVVWYYQGQWIAKRFLQKWKPEYGYYDIVVSDSALKFNFLWTKNPDLDTRIKYEYDPFRNYQPTLDDAYYELVWYMDPRFVPEGDKVWAVKCKNQNPNCLGTKDMGYLIPQVMMERNPEYEDLNIDLDSLYPPYYHLDHNFIHGLEKSFIPEGDLYPKQWVVKFTSIFNQTLETVYLYDVSPQFEITYNDDLPRMEYDLDYTVPYWDLHYDHIWLLDKKHCENAPEDIWALKINFRKNPVGEKVLGEVSPALQIEYNPGLPDLSYDIDYTIPYHDLSYEHVWMLDKKHCENAPADIWAVKITASNEPIGSKIMGEISPRLKFKYNPELPKMDYDVDYTIPYHDLGYDHVWLLDKKHCENAPEDIWAVKITACKKSNKTKIIGEVSPKLDLEYNPSLPKLKYDIDYTIPYHDFGYKHVWMLDKKHCENAPEDIWAVKISAIKNPSGTKIVDSVSPLLKYKINKDVVGYSFDLPQPIIQYHDFSYTQTWMLDTDFSGFYDIWAIKAQFVSNPVGEKSAGYIAPKQKILYNNDLKNIPRIKIEYKIPYHDRKYEHVWYLNENFTSGEKIWVAKLIASDSPKGVKEMGIVTPIMPDTLDVFFISYFEPNAEENWKRVLQKAPWAKRIDGVKGIFEAHRHAALQAESDMFYVVDGDAYLVDDWEFNYQPGVFDRDCTYVWQSKNPVNKLVYGYGGVKLFSKKEFLKIKKWTTLDMTTGIISKLCVMQKISNITAFNTDEFSTWKSAFRECVKLKSNAYKEPGNLDHVKRLAKWKTSNWKKSKSTPPFAEYATDGAIYADQFFEKHKGNETELLKINDIDWLKEEFNKRYGIKK